MMDYDTDGAALFDLFKAAQHACAGHNPNTVAAASAVALHEISRSLRSIDDHLCAIQYALEGQKGQ